MSSENEIQPWVVDRWGARHPDVDRIGLARLGPRRPAAERTEAEEPRERPARRTRGR